MDIEKFLVELRMSHQLGSFTSYVEQHWGEAVNELEMHDVQMEDINALVLAAKDDDRDFSYVKDSVFEEIDE
nr:hypothetical protein [Enterococcus innesii]